jgi:hypothetical protein
MESNMTDPKTARGCLAHCRDVLTDEQLRIAVDLIEDYASWRTADALDQYALDLRKILTAAFADPSKDTAQ